MCSFDFRQHFKTLFFYQKKIQVRAKTIPFFFFFDWPPMKRGGKNARFHNCSHDRM